MRNVTISLDEGVLKALRKYAADQGLSLQAYLRKVLSRETERASAGDLREMFRLADELGAGSSGWKFDREELHDRKVVRG